MFISTQDLQLREFSFQEAFEPGRLDLGTEVAQCAPIAVEGTASLLEEQEGTVRIADIRLVGDFSTQLGMKCARCLEPVHKQVSGHFDLVYRPLNQAPRPAEISIGPAESEIGFYQGDGLLLEDAVKEQVLLAVPLREICRADCKGLCAHCGRNLNSEDCQCQPPQMDTRWTALQDLKDKLPS